MKNNSATAVVRRTSITIVCLALLTAGSTFGEDVALERQHEAIAWDGTSNPYWFNHSLERDPTRVPRTAHVSQEVWTSSYFPLYQDTINVRWFSDGQPGLSTAEYSPAEKYDLIFNGWTPPTDFASLRPFTRSNWADWDTRYHEVLGPLGNWVTNLRGNKLDRDRIRDFIDNGTEWTGWPMESWWGLCHAWAPAALFERAPCGSVERNGVTFFTGDLEALLIQAYDEAWRRGMWLGAACRASAGGIERDDFGRPVDSECFDTNIGAFHVVVTTFLGLKDRPLIYDRIRSEEIWNQPLVGYRINRQDSVSAAQAAARLGVTNGAYIFNGDAVSFLDVEMDLIWMTESQPSVSPTPASSFERIDRLTYILELNADGLVVGGELYGSSLGDVAPDYLWQAEQLADSHLSFLNLQEIRGLIDESCGDPAGTTPRPAPCPDSVDGLVSCTVAEQACNNTWFTSFEGFDTALCRDGFWEADHLLGSTEPPPPPPPPAPTACPNGVFDDGHMYNEHLEYVTNQCNPDGASCQSVWFYGLGRFETALCSRGEWRPAN